MQLDNLCTMHDRSFDVKDAKMRTAMHSDSREPDMFEILRL